MARRNPCAARLLLATCLASACASDDDASTTTDVGDTTIPGPRAWSVVLSELPAALLSVWGRGHDALWLTGADRGDGTGPWVVRGDAAGFARVDLGAADPEGGHLWWAYGPGPDLVWLVGEGGRAFRHDPRDASTTRVTTGTDATLYGIWGASDADLWAVGGYVYPRAGPPTIVRIRDGAGEVVGDLPAALDPAAVLFKVWGRAPDDVWVVGDRGTIMRWDGARWTHEALPGGPRLVTVHGAGEALVAVGGATRALIFERAGDAWGEVAPAPYPLLNGVRVSDDGHALAVGLLGEILERGPEGWARPPEQPPLRKDWHAVWIDPRGDAWVVGGNLLSAARLDAGALLRLGPDRADVPSGPIGP